MSENARRLTITEGMRKYLDYPKFRQSTRMLVLETQYFFDKSWRHAAESMGWVTAGVPSAMTGGLTRDDIKILFTTIAEFKPDFILTSNYSGMDVMGLFARFFEDARIPYVSWFTDTPRMILYDRPVHCSYYAVAATWERGYVPYFERLGFEHIYFMPLATDPDLFSGAPCESCVRNLAFVGTSMIEQAEEAWGKLTHLPELTREILNVFQEGKVTRANFAEGVDHILPPELLQSLTASELRHVELCLIYEATRRQRAELVMKMRPYRIEVRGDPCWKSVEPTAGGSVGYYSDLSEYYRNTAVNLNSTSLQMKSAVNQRVFDCPASGGFLITDDQADLPELFEPNAEVVTYSTHDELEEKVRYYFNHPKDRMEIVKKAQRRIEAHHTHKHRLEELEVYLRARYSS